MLKIVFWVLLIELGGLLTPFVPRLSFVMSRLEESLVTFSSLRVSSQAQPLNIRVYGRLEDNS